MHTAFQRQLFRYGGKIFIIAHFAQMIHLPDRTDRTCERKSSQLQLKGMFLLQKEFIERIYTHDNVFLI